MLVDRPSRLNGLNLIQDNSSILAPSYSVSVVDCDGKAKARNGLPCGRQTQIVPYLLSSESSIFEGGRGREREREACEIARSRDSMYSTILEAQQRHLSLSSRFIPQSLDDTWLPSSTLQTPLRHNGRTGLERHCASRLRERQHWRGQSLQPGVISCARL